MIWVASLATALGLLVVWFAVTPFVRSPPELSPLDDRMSFYASSRDEAVDDELDRQSFSERIIDPLVARIARSVTRLTPGQYLERLDNSLSAAGNPYGLVATTFVALRSALAAVGLALGVTIGIFTGSALVGFAAAAVGALGPWWLFGYWLSSAIKARRRATLKALPNVVDFLVVAVDAGLNFDLALTRVVEKFHNPLTDGIATAISQIRLGGYRLEALEEFARRSDVP